MHVYLEQTKFAAQRIIETYTSDFHELNNQIKAFQEAGDWIAKWNDETRGKGILESALDKDNFPDQLQKMSDMIAQARTASFQVNNLSAELKAREHATQVLCGGILQIGKQAISVAHDNLAACPDGRLIGSQGIKHVIWQGRNQAIHFEEGHPRAPVTACFQALDHDRGLDLASKLPLQRNLATHVIDVLGWHSYDVYEADMISLVG